MSKHTVQWFKGETLDMGTITVNENGGLHLCPEDDYYHGEIQPIQARNLAIAILLAHGWIFDKIGSEMIRGSGPGK